MIGHRLRPASLRICSPAEAGFREGRSEISILYVLQDCLNFPSCRTTYLICQKFRTNMFKRWKMHEKRGRPIADRLTDERHPSRLRDDGS